MIPMACSRCRLYPRIGRWWNVGNPAGALRGAQCEFPRGDLRKLNSLAPWPRSLRPCACEAETTLFSVLAKEVVWASLQMLLYLQVVSYAYMPARSSIKRRRDNALQSSNSEVKAITFSACGRMMSLLGLWILPSRAISGTADAIEIFGSLPSKIQSLPKLLL